jgi:hypothetical protein
LTASALHSSGQFDTLTVLGELGAGQSPLGGEFRQRRWGGTLSLNRNLYVDGITFDDAAPPGARRDIRRHGKH